MRGLWIILGVVGVALILLITNSDQGSLLGISNDNFASAVFLGIWGAIIGAAIVPRSGGLKQAARNAVAWIAIILVLMTCYIYRFDIQDFGSRLTAGLIPGSPMSSQSADGRNQVMLIKDNSGHFAITANVNGTNIQFLADTGASSVVLSHEDAIRAGIDIRDLSYSVPVSTANGMTQTARANLATLDIGEIKRNNVPVMVAREGNLTTSLLGMSYFNTLWSFEIRGDRLILTE